MQRPVSEHISALEQRLRLLSAEIMEARKRLADRTRIESELRATEMALSYYRKALELERQISYSSGHHPDLRHGAV